MTPPAWDCPWPESADLVAALDKHHAEGDVLVSSSLAWIEVARGGWPSGPIGGFRVRSEARTGQKVYFARAVPATRQARLSRSYLSLSGQDRRLG